MMIRKVLYNKLHPGFSVKMCYVNYFSKINPLISPLVNK